MCHGPGAAAASPRKGRAPGRLVHGALRGSGRGNGTWRVGSARQEEGTNTLTTGGGMERDRARGTRVRRAGTSVVQRSSAQDAGDTARRWLATHLRHRMRVCGRQSPIRVDDRSAQGGGPQAGFPLCVARPLVPPCSRKGKRVAGRGQDQRTRLGRWPRQCAWFGGRPRR